MIWILFDLYFKNSLQDSPPPKKKNRQSEKQMQAEEMKTSSACFLCVFVFFQQERVTIEDRVDHFQRTVTLRKNFQSPVIIET